jgi:NAD(P)-dependent dehydrogenase (short-subunit alcohol dehydrogenase family)
LQVGRLAASRREVAPRRIRVNTIHPGPVDNSFQAGIEREIGIVIDRDAEALFDELIPLGRHATPRVRCSISPRFRAASPPARR